MIDRPAADRGPHGSAAVRTAGLAKSYRHPWTGRLVQGLHPLDFEVRRGEVMGYLGPNGAGKTTTLKLLTGLLKPTAGAGWLFDVSIDQVASRRSLGFLPEQPYFYEYLNGVEYLELAGRLSGLGAHDATRRATRWLGRVGLGDRPRLVLRKYSKGMLQRLGLAAALIHEPELLILDEPMSGLDPFGRRDVRDLILEQRARGTTVLFSSHILPDVEILCDRVAIVLHGRLTRVATVGELVSDSCQQVEIRCTGIDAIAVPPELGAVLTRLDRPCETVFTLADDARLNEAVAWLMRAGATVRAVTPQRATLEDLFLATAEAEDRSRHGVDGVERGADTRRSA
ncbi:MAG: ABC transporter ATP-binding protein [Candidatus Eisenbacteria bacterium]|uniref:ABC transporter ATP-binding protein n=1 Tax=Eiseniibacteriota bacterium TaxID=2212470 RepID=A0A9D6QJY3_UNCEI|nr:ABC transporter ATP-binding protein [Candidatus Eisenbacteria bacterium]